MPVHEAVAQRLQLHTRARPSAADSVVVLDRECYSEITVGDAVVMTVLDDFHVSYEINA